MSLKIDLKSLDALASQLPFHLDDTSEVNEVYCSYQERPHPSTSYLVDLWTYCYIRRYYLIKFIGSSGFRSSDLDQVVEKTYQKVERSRSQLERNDRYAQWVSVICKNTYVNFVTRRKYVTTLETDSNVTIELDEMGTSEDAGALFLALSRAIEKLPVFLRSIARLRFVEDLSYDEISRLTGKSIPTVRSYVHKVCYRFRSDSGLVAFRDWYE
ncbi:MAG: sigma-70 family RNA polymerase sigma factor [Bacteroidetes bacterium]|nr:MAG: sigma-70 family RNA polymerase sigma factor [Bacteroidota bacterium]